MLGFDNYLKAIKRLEEARPVFVQVPPNVCKGYPIGVLERPGTNGTDMGLGHILSRIGERVSLTTADIVKIFSSLCSVIKKSDRGKHVISVNRNGKRVGWLPYDIRKELDSGKMIIQLSTMLSAKMRPHEPKDKQRALEL